MPHSQQSNVGARPRVSDDIMAAVNTYLTSSERQALRAVSRIFLYAALYERYQYVRVPATAARHDYGVDHIATPIKKAMLAKLARLRQVALSLVLCSR
jgi:hypothetical protein